MSTLQNPTPPTAIRKVMADQLNQYSTLLHQLLTSFHSSVRGGPTTGSQASPQDITRSIIQLDQNLQTSVQTLIQQHEFQEKIEKLESQITQTDKNIQTIIEQLYYTERRLSEVVEAARVRVEIARNAGQHRLEVDPLIAFSHRLSTTSGAPPGWQEGMPIVPLRFPFPGSTEIPRSTLYDRLPDSFAPIDQLPREGHRIKLPATSSFTVASDSDPHHHHHHAADHPEFAAASPVSSPLRVSGSHPLSPASPRRPGSPRRHGLSSSPSSPDYTFMDLRASDQTLKSIVDTTNLFDDSSSGSDGGSESDSGDD